MVSNSVVYKILEVSGLAANKTITATRRPLGFLCDIYFPIDVGSAYQEYDNQFVYDDENPDFKGVNHLFTGLVVRRYKGDKSWDPYTGEEVRMFATNEDVFPDDSKVVVRFPVSDDPSVSETLLSLRVDRREGFHSRNHLFHEYVLVPMENC